VKLWKKTHFITCGGLMGHEKAPLCFSLCVLGYALILLNTWKRYIHWIRLHFRSNGGSGGSFPQISLLHSINC
jgi:hypothetical protein